METDKDFGVGKSKLHLPQRSLNFMHSPSFPPSFSQKMRSFQLPSKSCWGVYSPRALFSLWKHFPLSSTLLSPAQTCFRCPSDSPSAAVLWEALVQCSHSLHSAGWSLHPHTRQAVHWSLLFSGAVTLKTVSKEKERLFWALCGWPCFLPSLQPGYSWSPSLLTQVPTGTSTNPVLGSLPGLMRCGKKAPNPLHGQPAAC